VVDGEHGPSETRTGGTTILVVENDPAVQEAARLLLEVCGYRVIAVDRGADALQRLATGDSQPDLIVADYRLPQGETGTDVIERIRNELGQRIPAILVTGDTSLLTQSDLKRFDYRLLHKPVDSEQLLGLIHELLGKS
jgi:CheY-like chemotaxis protein